jgi:hypothetical protein
VFVSVSEANILAYLSVVSLSIMPMCPGIQMSVICFLLVLDSSNLFCMRIVMSFGFFLFLILFMAFKESLRITKLVCSYVFTFSMAFKIAIASAESIEHTLEVYMLYLSSNFRI